MGFLQEPPQHFLGSYMGFLSNFFKARICKACHHWPTQKIQKSSLFFSHAMHFKGFIFFPVDHWTSWYCEGISVCSLLPFCLRGLHRRGGSIPRAPQCDQAQGWRFEQQPVCSEVVTVCRLQCSSVTLLLALSVITWPSHRISSLRAFLERFKHLVGS